MATNKVKIDWLKKAINGWIAFASGCNIESQCGISNYAAAEKHYNIMLAMLGDYDAAEHARYVLFGNFSNHVNACLKQKVQHGAQKQ